MQVEVEENGFDLLDVLGLVAENIKLLILVPIVAGLTGFGVSYLLPQSFTSRAIVSLPAAPQPGSMQWAFAPPTPMQAASMMLTPAVLDSAIGVGSADSGKPLQVAREELGKRTKAAVGKDLLLRLDVTAQTPQEAQAYANAIIDAWLKSTRLGPRDIEALTKRLNYSRASLESVRRQLARLSLSIGTGLNVGSRDDPGSAMIALSELEARYSLEVMSLERAVEGLSRDVLVQEPTLPRDQSAPQRTLIAVASGLAVAFLLFLWVFIRYAWVISGRNPLVAKKQEKLLHALRLTSK